MQQRRPAIVAPELETAPFFRARRCKASLSLQWGAGQELCFIVCDLAVSSQLKVSLKSPG